MSAKRTRHLGAARSDRTHRGYTEGKIRTADGYTVVHVEDQTPGIPTAQHIARWDPDRVLAEVDAKRQRLEWIEGELADDPANATVQWLAQLDAAPYAGRPGYDESWAALSAVLAWMSRPDVELAVSIIAIVLSLIAIAISSNRR